MILIKGGYIVKKHDLTPKQIRCLQTELTVCPDLFNNNSPFARAQQTFKVYMNPKVDFESLASTDLKYLDLHYVQRLSQEYRSTFNLRAG